MDSGPRGDTSDDTSGDAGRGDARDAWVQDVSRSGACDGVLCSEHGTCTIESDTPTCGCDEGFHANGLACDTTCDGVAVLCVDPAGNDGFRGTHDQPYRTIQAAVDVAEAGARVFVRAGVYYERIVMPRSGTEAGRIVVEGERGADGERLVVVHGGDLVISDWVPAPEVGEWAYKTTSIDYEPFAMTVRLGGVSRDIPRLDREADGYRGILGTPPDARVLTNNNRFEVAYWDGIDAVYAYEPDTATTYIRFREGDDPNEMQIYSSPGALYRWVPAQGAVFMLNDVSHITVRGFEIDGGQNGVYLYGDECHSNIIEENEIVNGQKKVKLGTGVHHNHVRRNELHMRFIGEYHPGAWQSANRTFSSSDEEGAYRYAVAEHIYNAYKKEIGRGTHSPADDAGVYIHGAGDGNRVYENHIYDSLAGFSGKHFEGTFYFYENRIHSISSIATLAGENTVDDIHIFGNLIYDVNHAFRVQLNSPDPSFLAKHVWFFNNRVFNPPDIGSNIYISRTDIREDPPEDAFPLVWIYHNSFVGAGLDNLHVLNIGRDIMMVNNLFDSNEFWSQGNLGVVDYNWFSEGPPERMTFDSTGTHNVVGDGTSTLWPADALPSFDLPDTPTADRVRQAGIDMSAAFSIDGREFAAMPGLSPGYYSGTAPSLGAFRD